MPETGKPAPQVGRVVAVAVAVLLFVFWDRPTGLVVILLAVLLAGVELRPGRTCRVIGYDNSLICGGDGQGSG